MRGDDNDDGMMLSRRDAIRGGAALGTLALASRIGAYAQVVEAQITEPRIQLGSDYAIHDSGGNLVINHDPNGDILEYDAVADTITTLKPLTSVTTETLTVDGDESDLHYKLVGSSLGTGNLSVSLDQAYDELLIFYEADSRSDTPVTLVLDGDNASGNYAYFDDGGTANASENAFLLFDPSSSAAAWGGGIVRTFPTAGRYGLSHQFGFHTAHIGQISSYGVDGGWDSTSAPDGSVAFEGAGNGAQTVSLIVFGRPSI